MRKERKPDRRIRRTRRHLHRALYDLMETLPYEDITVSKIVDEADISRATFYLHYKVKDELLLDSLEAIIEDALESVHSVSPADDVSANLKFVALLIFQHVYDNQQVYLALYKSNLTASIIQHPLNTLIDTIQQYLTSDTGTQASYDWVAHQIAGSLYGLILWWLKTNLSILPDEMAQRFYNTISLGVEKIVKDPNTPIY